jgi:hypothetical protein
MPSSEDTGSDADSDTGDMASDVDDIAPTAVEAAPARAAQDAASDAPVTIAAHPERHEARGHLNNPLVTKGEVQIWPLR